MEERDTSQSKVQFASFNIRNTVWSIIKKNRWKWLGLVGLSLVWVAYSFTFLSYDPRLALFPPIFVLGYFYAKIEGKVRKEFWTLFAAIYSCSYTEVGIPDQETGVMFREGNSRKISHVITGNIDNQQVRIFEYQFNIKQGKTTKTYSYTVFAFKYSGTFPHIYLNYRKNSYGISAGEKIPVPAEFDKFFCLSTPRKYEIEALQIFTPDTLQYLLDMKLTYDVEFVGQELLLFTEDTVNSLAELKDEFEIAHNLNNHFSKVLNKINFTPIGTYSHSLIS